MANLWRARVILVSGTVEALLTTYWDFGAVGSTAGATEALARVRAMLASAAARINSSTVANFIPTVDELDSVTGDLLGSATGTIPTAVSFTDGADPLPLQTQGLLRLSTSTVVNGRRLRGRIFLPWVTESQNTGGFPVTAYQTAWNTAAALLDTTVVSSIAQQVWHRPQNGAGGLAAPVTARATANVWSVLKSRRS